VELVVGLAWFRTGAKSTSASLGTDDGSLEIEDGCDGEFEGKFESDGLALFQLGGWRGPSWSGKGLLLSTTSTGRPLEALFGQVALGTAGFDEKDG